MGIISKYLSFFQVYHYLIDWDGWPISAASWQPEENVTQDIIATYEVPEITDKRRVEETAVNLFVTIQKRLTITGCTPFEVSMPLDVFRHCFGQKGTPTAVRGYMNYILEDFKDIPLPPYWFLLVDSDGVGQQIVFPVLMKPTLSFTKQNYCFDDNRHLSAVLEWCPVEKILIRLCTDAYKL